MNKIFWVSLFVACGCRSAPAPAGVPSSSAPTSAAPAAPAASDAAPSPSPARKFSFDQDGVNATPAGFEFGRTGSGAAGRWIVRAESDAPSAPNALVQTDADATDSRFPIAIAPAEPIADVRVSVRCKPISGKVDQACGLVVRYQDENNYVLTRANALEGNVRLYVVKSGQRSQTASHSSEVKSAAWHTLVLEARGDHLIVSFDGAKVIDHHDATFVGAGRAGVWTKADSVTAFDDLSVEAL